MADAARIIWFFQRQLGLITREQCLACGLTEGQITHRLRSGIWTEIRPSVYALAGVPPSWEQAVLAVTLSRPPAYASHATTARLSAVRGFVEVPDAIEVLTPLGRKSRLDGVIGRRSGALFDADLTFRGPIPTVTVARSIVDVSGRVTTKELGYIVDDALRRKLLTLEGLRRCTERLDPAPGRSREGSAASSRNASPDIRRATVISRRERCARWSARGYRRLDSSTGWSSQDDASGSTWPTQSSASPSSSTVGTHIDSAPRSTPTTRGETTFSWPSGRP